MNLTEKAKEYLSKLQIRNKQQLIKLPLRERESTQMDKLLTDFTNQILSELQQENQRLNYQISSHKTHGIELTEMLQQTKAQLEELKKASEKLVNQLGNEHVSEEYCEPIINEVNQLLTNIK